MGFFKQSLTPPILSGLVGWWKFQEGTGSYVHDAMPHGTNMSSSGNVMWSSSFNTNFITNGKCTTIVSGSDAGMQVSNLPVNFPLAKSPRTICVWTNPISYGNGGNDGALVSVGIAGSGQTFSFLGQFFNGAYYLFTDSVNGGNNITTTLGNMPPTSSWSHTAFSFDGNTTWRYYLNGVQILTGTYSVAINTTMTGMEFGIRHNSSAGQKAINGSIADIRIYNRALSQQEIAILARNL